MLLAFTDKTRVSVEEPKTIIWIYEMRIFIYIPLSNSKNPNKFCNNINLD